MLLKKIHAKVLYEIAQCKIIDNFFLLINEKYNNFLLSRLTHSFKVRAALYSEGGVRLSNDPDINLYYRWPTAGSIIWAEVASFNIKAMMPFVYGGGGKSVKVLELGCANGWYYREFYSNLNKIEYVGCDLAQDIIKEANDKLKRKMKKLKRTYKADFVVSDMCKEDTMPKSADGFTNVFWFASICMFTKEQRKNIFTQIIAYLDKNNGILSGSAVIKNNAIIQWTHYIGLFDDENELREELSQYFKNIYITRNSDENSRFFMASNGELPCYNK